MPAQFSWFTLASCQKWLEKIEVLLRPDHNYDWYLRAPSSVAFEGDSGRRRIRLRTRRNKAFRQAVSSHRAF